MYWISRRPAPIETVEGAANTTGKYVITDGERIVEVIHVQDMAYELGDPSLAQGHHSQDMLMVYLPKEKILFNADLYSPAAPGAPPAAPTAAARTLQENLIKLKIQPERHVPVHGRVGTQAEFLAMFPGGTKTN
jgi:hypothetical protein